MIKTIAQTKALLRATPLNERLDLLTDIFLEVDDEAIERFTDGYRVILSAHLGRKAKKDVAGVSRKEKAHSVSIKKDGNEIHREEDGPHWAQLEINE